MKRECDFLIVGCGFAGAVLAERIASVLGKRVLLIDRREHVGGNAFDCCDDTGLLLHKYGPHIFHTDDEAVFRYLSSFTRWRFYEHRVLTCVDGRLLPFPINLDTINGFFGLSLTSEEAERFLEERRLKIDQPRNLEEFILSQVGRELYEKFYRGYTTKMWGMDPKKLSPEIVGRIPVRTTRDDRYFTDRYQFMPAEGYTRLFERMLDSDLIEVATGVDFSQVRGHVAWERLIYTGPIDEYFDYCFGVLPYRSLKFRFEVRDCRWYQPAAVVNYPNDHDYTRITEYKHITGQVHDKTVVSYEFPTWEGEPYYPVLNRENMELYGKYRKLADEEKGVTFVGRLAEYRYYTMEEVVRRSLDVFRELAREV